MKWIRSFDFITESKRQKSIEEYFDSDLDSEFLDAARFGLLDLDQHISFSECWFSSDDGMCIRPITRKFKPCIYYTINFEFYEKDVDIIKRAFKKFINRIKSKAKEVVVQSSGRGYGTVRYDDIRIANGQIMIGKKNFLTHINKGNQYYEGQIQILLLAEEQNFTWQEFFGFYGTKTTKLGEYNGSSIYDLKIEGDRVWMTCHSSMIANHIVSKNYGLEELCSDGYIYGSNDYKNSSLGFNYQINKENIKLITEILESRNLLTRFFRSLEVDNLEEVYNVRNYEILNTLSWVCEDINQVIQDTYRIKVRVPWMIRYQNELNSQFKKLIETYTNADVDVFFMDNKRWVTFEFTEKMKNYILSYEKKESVSEFANEIFGNFQRRRLDLNVQHNVSSEEFNKILNENLQEFK